jgi:hypothetical protein
VVFIAETPRPQSIAEKNVNTSALLRDLCDSALKINNNENTILLFGSGTRTSVEERKKASSNLPAFFICRLCGTPA